MYHIYQQQKSHNGVVPALNGNDGAVNGQAATIAHSPLHPRVYLVSVVVHE